MLRIRISYQTIIAEGIARPRKEGISRKASLEKPVQVLLHESENFTNNTSIKTVAHDENELARAAPEYPIPSLSIKIQQTKTCSKVEIPEQNMIGNTMLCACKNLTRHWTKACAKMMGIMFRA